MTVKEAINGLINKGIRSYFLLMGDNLISVEKSLPVSDLEIKNWKRFVKDRNKTKK